MKRAVSLFLSILMVWGIFFAVPQVAKAAESNVISKENPAVVIRTSFATGKYSEGWGGVFEAVQTKDKDGFVLYDIVIWEDRINLYKFPNNLEMNEKQGFDTGLLTETGGTKKYVKWRESFCLKSVKCKNTDDISKCSGTMKKAYIEFFKIVNKRSPSTNVVLKYSGHGNLGFCGCMDVEDSKSTLKKGVEIFGQRFSLIDFGTNCQTSNTSFFNVYHSFTDYMLTSQFDHGGIEMDEWDYEEFEKYNVDSQYANVFKIGKTVKDAGKSIVNTNAKYWKLCKKSIKKGKHKQSMTLTDCTAYQPLAAEYNKLNGAVGGKDMYAVILKQGGSKLKKLYKNFVIHYKDNNSKSEYFKWDSKSYGVTAGLVVPTVKLSKTSYTYNGNERKPTVSLSNTNGYLYDYKLSYDSGRKNVGEYNVWVNFESSTGMVRKTFTIKPKSTSITSLKAQNDGFKLKWNKRTTQVTGYQIRYSTSSKFSSYKDLEIKKDTTTSKTVKELKNKKKYYVKIRTYKTVDGKKIYSSWSKTKSVKTK